MLKNWKKTAKNCPTSPNHKKNAPKRPNLGNSKSLRWGVMKKKCSNFIIFSSTHIDDNCMDRPDVPCDAWKSHGLCDVYNPDMHKVCRKTCGFCHICEDHETNCTDRKTAGECDDPAMKMDMISVCQKTCEFCGEHLHIFYKQPPEHQIFENCSNLASNCRASNRKFLANFELPNRNS